MRLRLCFVITIFSLIILLASGQNNNNNGKDGISSSKPLFTTSEKHQVPIIPVQKSTSTSSDSDDTVDNGNYLVGFWIVFAVLVTSLTVCLCYFDNNPYYYGYTGYYKPVQPQVIEVQSRKKHKGGKKMKKSQEDDEEEEEEDSE